jgi:antitoxin VapB
MGKQFKAKIFKSGNSLALRLPKSLGVAEGDDIVISPHADGSFSLWKEQDALKVFMSLYGSMSPGFMSEGRGDIEQDDYDWGQRGSDSDAA